MERCVLTNGRRLVHYATSVRGALTATVCMLRGLVLRCHRIVATCTCSAKCEVILYGQL